MFVEFDFETFKIIYLKILEALSLILFGMVAYRFSILYKLRENKVVSKAAFTDNLTGKGNRHKFNSIMEKLIQDTSKKFALCFMDLDGFKHINDNMGHDAGDELLIKLSDLLSEYMPANGEVFRLGGDEFAFVIRDVKDKEEVATTLDKIALGVKKPIKIRDSHLTLEYSLGVAMFPDDSTDSGTLVNYADTAMYHVKETGKNSYYFHNEALKSSVDNRAKMERDLREAFNKEEFDIDFQPRINLKNTDELWLESLLYWDHTTLGKLRAEYFIKHAENIGLIIQIDEYVLKKSIEKLNYLKQKGYSNVKIAMNISLRHFLRRDFVDKLCDILSKETFDVGSIMFEITDNITINKIEEYRIMLDKIKEYGVKISLNNLETKYEIMSLFKKLPIDEVKVSADYIEKSSAFNKNVLKDIIELGKDLYYEVCVIRIEDEENLNKILKYEVDKIQGNILFKPVTNVELLDFLAKFRADKYGFLEKIKR